jgi:hypothetical protein
VEELVAFEAHRHFLDLVRSRRETLEDKEGGNACIAFDKNTRATTSKAPNDILGQEFFVPCFDIPDPLIHMANGNISERKVSIYPMIVAFHFL